MERIRRRFDVDEYFWAYREVYDGQQKIIRAGEDIEALRLDPLEFPHLTSITIMSRA